MIAGASSRMNTAEAPTEVKAMVDEEFLSKALVPIGMVDDRVITYLDAFGINVARLFTAIEKEAIRVGKNGRDVWKNIMPLLSNDVYLPEHLVRGMSLPSYWKEKETP